MLRRGTAAAGSEVGPIVHVGGSTVLLVAEPKAGVHPPCVPQSLVKAGALSLAQWQGRQGIGLKPCCLSSSLVHIDW